MTSIPVSGAPFTRPLKGKPGYSVFENPKFDSRILAIPTRQVVAGGVGNKDTSLTRGQIITQDPREGIQYKVNFLYNPSTITESRSVDVSQQVLPDYARVPGDPGQYKTGLNTTVGFSLLFDRTFELWDSKYLNTDVGQYGCLMDVNAFYNLLNINQKQQHTYQSGPVEKFSKQTYTMIVQGNMSVVPCNVYFGTTAPGTLQYFGYISSLTVTYTHFSQLMIPMRCAVDVGFTSMAATTTTN